MGNICSCLCPERRKKAKAAYDVHQETFEMEENIDSMNIDDNSPTIAKDVHLTDQIDPEERQSTESLISKSRQSDDQKLTKKQQKKYIETKIMASNKKQSLSDEAVSFKMDNEYIDSQKNIKSRNEPANEQQPAVLSLLSSQEELKNHSEPIPVQPPRQQAPQPPKQQQKPSNPNILKTKTIKKKYNPDDYQFKDEEGKFRVKKIDSIKCQQYNIDNCKNSEYFIFDVTANVYIDDTNDCKIYIAPCESTIFVRNCKNLTVVAATKQFRTFECHNCVFSLLCKSQPVIESSSQLTFTPFQIKNYAEFNKQMNTARLQLWNNHWSQIHNFTKKEGQTHHILKRNLPQENELNWEKGFVEGQIQHYNQMQIPFIQGFYPLQMQEYEKFIILFNKDISKDDHAIIQCIKGYRILKSFKGKIAGFGKEDRVALLLTYTDVPSKNQTLESMGQLFTSEQEISQYEPQFFVSFRDSREN